MINRTILYYVYNISAMKTKTNNINTAKWYLRKKNLSIELIINKKTSVFEKSWNISMLNLLDRNLYFILLIVYLKVICIGLLSKF